MSVFAADTPTINAAPATVLQAATSTVGIPLKKDIVLFNVDQSQILSPNVTYSYEITTPEVNGAEITTYDPNDLNATTGEPNPGAVAQVVTVKTGVLGAVTTVADIGNTDTIKEGSISFGAENDANTNDNSLSNKKPTNSESAANVDLTKKVTGSMTITIDANKIYDHLYGTTGHTNAQENGPGVYRYKIEDKTAATDLTAAGIKRATGYDTDNTVIYLDVYTKYNDNRDGLVVYGYVFLKATNENEDVDVNYVKSNTEALKVTGFDTGSENTNITNNTVASGQLKSDSYHTYNVEVMKKTAGSLADDKHNFPFKVELSNNTITSSDDFYYQITKDNNPQNEVAANLSDIGSWTLNETLSTDLQLHNDDKIVITGLPVGTKIKVKETNDTNDTYTVSAKSNNTTDLTLKKNDETTGTSLSVGHNGTAEMDALANVNKTTGKDEIVFTNTLKDISVTGLLFNIAPFVFITIAGAVLLVLVMRSKKGSDSKSKI